MEDPRQIHIEEYSYELPDERIARYPLPQRDGSKLLIYRNNEITESVFNRISEFIPENALLIFNNTKVIRARMLFQKETGAQIEIFCLEPKEPVDYSRVFVQNHSCTWLCLLGNAKRWKSGKLFQRMPDVCCSAERLESQGEAYLIRFEWDNPEWTFADILEACGEMPIPPYLNRKTEESDQENYQTVYSKIQGSVAAPTAGLHFTENVFDALRRKKIDLEELTLHVGAGTFKPVKSAALGEHEMHEEYFSVQKTILEKLMEKEGRIFAVGTTSVRTLESLYYMGLILETCPDASPEELRISQWFPYSGAHCRPPISVGRSLHNLLDYLEKKDLDTLTARTQILIAPGYTFRIVNGMITNFHQPKSTLLLLISAFVNGQWREIYDYALSHQFRFLSYGDSSFLLL
jgi:S-adenosylmethionine:tRNA ribosyltransferase-isomerase